MESTLVLSLIVLGACLIIGFVVWMVAFDRKGHQAMKEENSEQASQGKRRQPS